MDGAPAGPKTDRDHLIIDNYCSKTFEMAKGKKEIVV